MGVTYTVAQLQKLKRVEVDGLYVHIDKVTPKGKVSKLPNLLERASLQSVPDNSLTGNKKVKNATKIIVDGVKFDSQLEYYMYKLLRGAGIDFEFQKVYELQHKFKYGTVTIRAITLTVDFWIAGKYIIIDTKGFQTQQGAIRWKMLKWHFFNHPKNNDWIEKEPPIVPVIYMPKNKKECDLLLNRLIYEKTT